MLRVVVMLFGLTLSSLALAQEPSNLSSLKSELKLYHDSGEYSKDISTVVNKAKRYLQERIDTNNQLKTPKKLAIVLDIDETSLSNYSLMQQYDFSDSLSNGFPAHLNTYTGAKTIKPTLDLVQFAQQNHVAVFFVTGRPEFLRHTTIHTLHKTGYNLWAKLYFKPENYQQPSIAAYKTAVRKEITDNGYEIVVNMGDQCSDLHGGYAEQTYKLPDPFYFIP